MGKAGWQTWGRTRCDEESEFAMLVILRQNENFEGVMKARDRKMAKSWLKGVSVTDSGKHLLPHKGSDTECAAPGRDCDAPGLH